MIYFYVIHNIQGIGIHTIPTIEILHNKKCFVILLGTGVVLS